MVGNSTAAILPTMQTQLTNLLTNITLVSPVIRVGKPPACLIVPPDAAGHADDRRVRARVHGAAAAPRGAPAPASNPGEQEEPLDYEMSEPGDE